MPKLAPKWQKRETTADLEQTQLGNAKTLRNGFKRLIDVNDFDSVKDLAVYLKRLSQNLTEYRKYFKWKGQYNKYHYNKWCQLCAKLNEDSMPNLIENAYDLWFKRKNGDYICSNGADRKYNKNSHLKPNKILGSPDIEREIVHIFE